MRERQLAQKFWQEHFVKTTTILSLDMWPTSIINSNSTVAVPPPVPGHLWFSYTDCPILKPWLSEPQVACFNNCYCISFGMDSVTLKLLVYCTCMYFYIKLQQ